MIGAAVVGFLGPFAGGVRAWKPLTHANLAWQAVQELSASNPDFQLLMNQRAYVSAGSIGPDLYYGLAPSGDAVLSDLAHYCKTATLAENILTEAGSDPKLVAFALGWISHNAADSVSHPWVNGFVGEVFQPSYWQLLPGGINYQHGHLEAWVAQHYTPEDQELFAFALRHVYVEDESVQQLLGRAFEKTYGDIRPASCAQVNFIADPRFQKLRVAQLTRGAGVAMSRFWRFGAFADDLPGPTVRVAAKDVIATTPEYLSLTKAFILKAWAKRKAPFGFNLDIGINADNQEVGDDAIYGPVSIPESNRQKVFDVPGVMLNLGHKPGFIDRCAEMEKPNGDVCVSNPGGDRPDDNVSLGSPPSLLQLPQLRDLERAAWRLAVKHGQVWPAFAARLRALAAPIDAALVARDAIALKSAYQVGDNILREGSAASASFRATYASPGRPNATVFVDAGDVALLYNGFAESTSAVLAGFEEPTRWVEVPKLSGGVSGKSVLVIPSGGLYGLSTNDQFRSGLASYVSSGGTVVVFAQQRGVEYSVLPTTSGEPIHGFGWSEDVSCYTNGAYIDSFHPILASQSSALVTSNIDGYFDAIPSDAIVLLRRVKNGLPTMFMYQYGQGWIIVSSSYDDWGGYNQTGPGARAIIRDAVAWAKQPAELGINTPGSTVTISLQVLNATNAASTAVKLVLMSPSRDRVIAEETASLSVAAGGTAVTSFTYAIPADAELGIYHLDYELVDGAGETIQPTAEDDTGRIVVARPPSADAYKPPDLLVSVVNVSGDSAVGGDPVLFRYRIVNNAATPRHLHLWTDLNHEMGTRLPDLLVPPNTIVERDLTLTEAELNPCCSRRYQLNLWVFEEGGTPRESPGFFVGSNETGAFQTMTWSQVNITAPRVTIEISPGREYYAPDEPVPLTLTIHNETAAVNGSRR